METKMDDLKSTGLSYHSCQQDVNKVKFKLFFDMNNIRIKVYKKRFEKV